MPQKIYDFTHYNHPINHLAGMIEKNSIKKILVVCGKSFEKLQIADFIKSLNVEFAYFQDFQPNPLYENCVAGIKKFHDENCDAILAVGGGSAIDVAKCIKLYENVPENENFLFYKENNPREIPFIAIPTTAGTGSESTRFAVIYYEGNKQSVHDTRIIPNYVILDGSTLLNLPDFQKKCTFLDALCQAIESWWSVNRTSESIEYSKQAINGLLTEMDAYFSQNCTLEVCNKIMLASNMAGKAINITSTTAPHAMSYKVSAKCNIPHGYAVASCLMPCFEFMNENVSKTRIPEDDMAEVFDEISFYTFGCGREGFLDGFKDIMSKLGLPKPKVDADYIEFLAKSVNPDRLKNNPIIIEVDDFKKIYSDFL